MRRARLLLALTGIGALLVGSPCAALESGPAPDGPEVTAGSTRALGMLNAAARAAHTRTWSGTQYVSTSRSGELLSTVLQVTHTAGQERTVRVVAGAAEVVTADVLDDTLLGLLATSYDLVVAGQSRCAGYQAQLVEARRPGVEGNASVAGRFWIDAASGLVLRRDVFDEAGEVVRSSAFVDLAIAPAGRPASTQASYESDQVMRPEGRRLGPEALLLLADAGWPVIRALPGGMSLFEARLHEAEGSEVLQLAYSDGLSTLSLFVQPGEAPMPSGAASRTVGGAAVWEDRGTPARRVWSGDGRTWTLVSDATERTVDAAVEALPHGSAPSRGDSVLPRTWRGMARVGSWLNPFT